MGFAHVHLVSALQPLRNGVQSGIVASLRLDFGNGRQYVVPVCAGSAMSLADQMDLMIEIKSPGVLGVAAIDKEDQRRYIVGRRRCERNATQVFTVNGSYLFAFPQVRDGGTAVLPCHPIRDAATSAPTVEAKHEAWLFRGTAVNEGIHAQGPVQPDEPRRDTFKVREARPPH